MTVLQISRDISHLAYATSGQRYGDETKVNACSIILCHWKRTCSVHSFGADCDLLSVLSVHIVIYFRSVQIVSARIILES